MITEFKIFESINVLEIGDYVICNVSVNSEITNSFYKKEQNYKEFIRNNIGQYVKNEPEYTFSYLISYEYIPNEFKGFIIKVDEFPNLQIVAVEKDEILVYSKNKKDLEIKLAANKYNL